MSQVASLFQCSLWEWGLPLHWGLLFPLFIISVLVCKGCLSKVPQTGWFKQQFIFSLFCKLTDQGVGKVGFSEASLLVLCMTIFFLFSHGLLSTRLCPYTQGSYRINAHPNNLIVTQLSLKRLFPNTETFWGTGGQDFSTWTLGTQSSP